MSKRDDGGPAFPQSVSADGPYGGLTARDWFAGQALAGLLANATLKPKTTFNEAAAEAFAFADAMLAERAKREGE